MLVIAFVATAAATAAAQSKALAPSEARAAAYDVMRVVTEASAKREPAALLAMMDRAVRFDVRDGMCDGKAFNRPGRATGRQRLALARCIIAIGVAPGGADRIVAGKQVTVERQVYGAVWRIGLRQTRGQVVIASVEYGDERGDQVGGTVGGFGLAPPPPPPPPSATPPLPMVSTRELENGRLSGEPNLVPDEATRAAIAADSKSRVLVSIKVCVDAIGVVSTVNMLYSSGYPAYDDALRDGIRKWRFRPFLRKGQATPVCAVATFDYRPDAPASQP